MPIVKRGRKREFAQIPNDIIEHENLSNDAKIVLIYLISKPENWEVQFEQIQRFAKIGRDKRQAIFAKLEEFGYFQRIERRGARARFEYDYVVYDSPLTGNTSAVSDPPLTDPPLTENTSAVYKENNTDSKKTQKEVLREKALEVFTFWQERFDYKSRKFAPREKFIVARLRDDGFSVDDLKKAIIGVDLSDFHRGRDPDSNGKHYDDFETIFRNAIKVDEHIARVDQMHYRVDFSASKPKEEQRRERSLRELDDEKRSQSA